jgi:pyruvate,orthophosphate dikinase
MFLDDDHLGLVREMVLAYDIPTRRRVVEHILPVQREDFTSILKAFDGRPMAIRLLDLPLHDLMPEENSDLASVAGRLETTVDQLAHRARILRPSNPVLGHRGCRLGITFAELYEVQVRALFEAAVDLGITHPLQILIPLVTSAEEVKRLRRRIAHMSKQVSTEKGRATPPFTLGAMIESPIGCLNAGAISEHCDFLLVGTTDLTISTFAINRDDAGRYLPFYIEQGILPNDPFVELDDGSVGELIRIAIAQARAANPTIEIGLGGGHANEVSTASWCIRHSLDYITCAPHRLPMIRLAAAQAAIAAEDTKTI